MYVQRNCLEQSQFACDQIVVGRLIGITDELNDPCSCTLQRCSDTEHLVGACLEGADLRTLAGAMHPGTRRGEAERTCVDGLFAQLRHGFDLAMGGSNRVVSAISSHHIGPQGCVRNLSADIEGPRHLIELVEILREGFPTPAHAFGQRCTGDVLDAFE